MKKLIYYLNIYNYTDNMAGQIKLEDISTIIFDNYFIIDQHFNENIDNYKFPDIPHTIVFGEKFNQKLDNVIFSDNLLGLHFGQKFNQKLDNVHFPDKTIGTSFWRKFQSKT